MKKSINKICKNISLMTLIMLLIIQSSAFAYNLVLEPGQNTFEYEIELDNIEEPFASAQFEISVSDKNEIRAVNISFDDDIISKADGTVNTISSGGKESGNQIVYKAGFFSTSNQFKGKLKIGTITFSYTGDSVQTIILDKLDIIRITGDYENGVPVLDTRKETWSKTIEVSREDSTEEKVAVPQANPQPGIYKNKVDITLTCSTGGAKIYYTLDGSNPTRESLLYTKPISLDKTATIKAFAVKDGLIDSSIATFSYTISTGSGSGSVPGPGDDKPQIEEPVTEEPSAAEPVVFDDVNINDWFYEAVQYVYRNNLMKGTSSEPMLFSPHASTTRGMVVTILYRMEGSPKLTAVNPFDDVNAGQYYTDAVIWASSNSIVSGYGNNMFGPNDVITREQLAVILMNYAKFKGYDVSARAELSSFGDAASVSPWAREAVSWSVNRGSIQGSNNMLMPGGNAERCQLAAILQRFIAMYSK